MGNSLKRHVSSAFLITHLNLKLLLLWDDWSFRLFLFFSRRLLSVSRCGISLSLLLFLRSGGLGTSTGLYGNFFFFLPRFSEFDALKLWNLVNIVFNADRKLGFGARYLSLGSLALADIVLGDRIR